MSLSGCWRGRLQTGRLAGVAWHGVGGGARPSRASLSTPGAIFEASSISVHPSASGKGPEWTEAGVGLLGWGRGHSELAALAVISPYQGLWDSQKRGEGSGSPTPMSLGPVLSDQRTVLR